MKTQFLDSRGRDWTVRVDGSTLADAARYGIEISADVVSGIMEALKNTLGEGEVPSAEMTAEEAARAAEEKKKRDMELALQLGSKVLSLKLIGTLVDICWLGCRHHSRVRAEKVDERSFKESLHGESLIAAGMATMNALFECFGLSIAIGKGDGPDPTSAANAAESKGAGSAG